MIFIHIPKTAGWTIARHLRDDEKIMDNGFGFAHEITMRDIPENYEDIVLSVVRCPFDRVWSMYNFYGNTRKAFLDIYTFEEFVSNIEEWSTNEDHEYYMIEYKPCYYWIEPKTFKETEYGWVNKNLHLLRFENLQESYNTFRKSIGLEPFRLLKRNVKVAIDKIVKLDKENRNLIQRKELLEKELLKHNYSLPKMIKSGKIQEITRHFGHRKPEQLYLAIGNGTSTLNKVIKHIVPEVQKTPNPISTFINRFRSKTTSPVLISGHEGVMTTFAQCCNPLPGENITGFITRGKGVSIHRSTCPQLLNSDLERRIEVAWHTETSSVHTSEIEILCSDHVGLLAELGAACKIQNINISRLEAKNVGDNKAKISLEVSVSDVSQLDKVMKSIQKIPGIIRLRRVQEKPV